MNKWTMALAISSLVAAGPGVAATISGNSLQNVLDGIATDGDIGLDVNADQMTSDEVWSSTGTGISTSTMIIELADYAGSNSFGIYDVTNSSNRVTLFDGSDGSGAQVTFGFTADGSVRVNLADTGVDFAGNLFGFFLDGPGGIFYSQAALNGGIDHMASYAGDGSEEIQIADIAAGDFGPGEFILAWEDNGGDFDYEDMVLIVQSVVPNQVSVPEPASLALLGLGMAGLGLSRRRKSS